jgi:hypothetical protein
MPGPPGHLCAPRGCADPYTGAALDLFVSFLRISGAEDPRAAIVRREEEGLVFLLTWKER